MLNALYWGSVKLSIEELVAAIQAGDQSLMEALWEAVVNLVKWKAKRTMTSLELLSDSSSVEFEDLVQSGYFALVSALETYKPECGAFSSWLMYYLQTAFADAAGYRTKQGRIENTAISLNEPLDDEESQSRRVDFVADGTAQDAMESIEEQEYQKQLHEALEAALAEIPEKQGQVLRLRYFQKQTLGEAGESLGVSVERVRQMEQKGLRTLRQSKTAAHLIPFLEFDFYTGTGLGAFVHSGMSIQEKYLILEEQKRQRKEQKERAEREKKHAEFLRQMEEREKAWRELLASLGR